MNQRILLATLLSIGVVLLWYRLFAPQPVQRPTFPPSSASDKPSSPHSGGSAGEKAAIESPTKKEIPARTWSWTIADGNVRLGLSSRAGAVTEWKWNGIDLLLSEGEFLSTPGLEFLWKPQGEEAEEGWEGQARRPDGLRIRKRLAPSRDQPGLFRVEVEARNESRRPVSLPSPMLVFGPGIGGEKNRILDLQPTQRPIVKPAGRRVRKVSGRYEEEWLWAGLDNRYYLAAWIPKDPSQWRLQVEARNKLPIASFSPSETSLQPGQARRWQALLYVGPKGYRALRSISREGVSLGLQDSINYGWFDPIARAMLWFLLGIQKIVGNFGAAILLLTVLIQACLFPLSVKSYKSMQKMKELQPKIEAIRLKWKDDIRKQQQEMAELWKSQGANPLLGGCLPMLLQFPIFIALYNTLLNSYELKDAPFFLWISDLSRPDPYYVLPVLMGVSMFVQQKMMATPGMDPQMEKFNKFFPLIFVFVFIRMPAGLVLYWLSYNILSVLTHRIYKRAVK